MGRMRNFFILGFILGIYLFLSTSAFSHTLWINATDYFPELHPKYGGQTIIYFGWGHHYPVDGFLSQESLQDFYLIGPKGDKTELKPNSTGFLETKINFQQSGMYIVSAVKKPGFYTMYVENGEIHHKIGPKTGLKGVILSLYYEQYAKCLINVGKIEDDSFQRPIGHKLEIIPLKNPYKLSYGEFLPIKVLFEGKPLSYCKVYATYMGFSTGDDFAYATSTDGEGIANIRIIHWGPWLIKASVNFPAPDELKDKCNEMHYTATLTFEVP